MFTSKMCTGTIIPLIILLFIHSVPLHSQNKGVIIKDSVAIFPHTNPAQAVTTEDWTIEVSIYWESIGGVPWRVFYDHYISRYYGACHSNYAFFDGQNPYTFAVNKPRVGEYEFKVDGFAGRITKVIIKDTGFPDYVINNPNFVFKYITPYYSGFRFDGDTTEVQNLLYEEAYYELGSFAEEKRCDAETRYVFSGTPEITYRITQGTEYASLVAVNLFEHIILGDTYNARIYDDIPGVAANGKLPPDSGALVVVEASIARFTAQTKFMVRPYHFRLKEPATITAGTEATLRAELVD